MRANVEDRGLKGDCTPLMEAASAGHVDIVKLLLAHRAEVNAQSQAGEYLQLYWLQCFMQVALLCIVKCVQSWYKYMDSSKLLEYL